MNNPSFIPPHLFPVGALFEPLTVTGEVREKMRDDKQQTSEAFQSLGWTVPVRGVREYSEMVVGGTRQVVPVPFDKNVTVWSMSKPVAHIGDSVVLEEPLIGAIDGNLYIQCRGVSPYIPDEDSGDNALADMLEDEGEK